MWDLVWECERVRGLERRQEDDEELPERRWVGDDSVLMKRWVRVGNEFDRGRNSEELWTSYESTLATDCLRMVETFV